MTRPTALFPYQAHRPASLLSPTICWSRGAEPTDLQGDKVTLEPFIPGLDSFIAWLALHRGNKFSKPEADRLVEVARPLKCCTSLVLLYRSPSCTLGLYNWSESQGATLASSRFRGTHSLPPSSARPVSGLGSSKNVPDLSSSAEVFFKILWFQHLPPGRRLLLFVLS